MSDDLKDQLASLRIDRGVPRSGGRRNLLLVGGALGCLLAFPMNGYTAGTGQTQSFSEIAFAFRVTPECIVSGLLLAVGMGLVGGLLPAIRAARLPITTALREG